MTFWSWLETLKRLPTYDLILLALNDLYLMPRLDPHFLKQIHADQILKVNCFLQLTLFDYSSCASSWSDSSDRPWCRRSSLYWALAEPWNYSRLSQEIALLLRTIAVLKTPLSYAYLRPPSRHSILCGTLVYCSSMWNYSHLRENGLLRWTIVISKHCPS